MDDNRVWAFEGSLWTGDASDRQVRRPEEGLIVVAYKATAPRDAGDDDVACCTSTYRRLSHETGRVVQHQQAPPLSGGAEAAS